MLKKKYRFSFRTKIPSNTIHSKSFVLRFGISNDFLKVAVVVGKKVDKRATVRNKVKRNIVNILKDNLDIKTKNSIIVFAKKQIQNLNDESLRDEIKKSLVKIT